MTRLSQRGLRIPAISASTPARGLRVLRPGEPLGEFGQTAAGAVPRVWANPWTCLACRVGEWVTIRRRSAPSATPRVSKAVSPG